MSDCLSCGTDVDPFLDFGPMPIANAFLTHEDLDHEQFFDLEVGFCPACSLVQLTSFVESDKLFHGAYPFYSSTSRRMARHFQQFAESIQSSLPAEDPFVVEIGSNDGIFLRHVAAAGVRHLGVEPSENVARVAAQQGIRTLCRFFDETTAREIVEQHGQADVIVAANVLCHIPALHAVIRGIRHLLQRDGLFIFEDPYLPEILEKTAYDQIYDEHACYFSVTSVAALFDHHDLEVIDVLPQRVHGGSMRYVIGRKGLRAPSSASRALHDREKSLALRDRSTYQRFRERTDRSRSELMRLLTQLKDEGRSVVGYGATSKSTTVTNYCGITPELIDYISDTTPEKQGRLSPGVHIPIRPHEQFAADYPDYTLLFAWNHAEEILEKEAAFRASGGRWITYVPEVGFFE